MAFSCNGWNLPPAELACSDTYSPGQHKLRCPCPGATESKWPSPLLQQRFPDARGARTRSHTSHTHSSGARVHVGGLHLVCQPQVSCYPHPVCTCSFIVHTGTLLIPQPPPSSSLSCSETVPCCSCRPRAIGSQSPLAPRPRVAFSSGSTRPPALLARK